MKNKALKEFTSKTVNKKIDEAFFAVHEFAKTTSGDENVGMVLELERIQKDLTALIILQVNYNL